MHLLMLMKKLRLQTGNTEAIPMGALLLENNKINRNFIPAWIEDWYGDAMMTIDFAKDGYDVPIVDYFLAQMESSIANGVVSGTDDLPSHHDIQWSRVPLTSEILDDPFLVISPECREYLSMILLAGE